MQQPHEGGERDELEDAHAELALGEDDGYRGDGGVPVAEHKVQREV